MIGDITPCQVCPPLPPEGRPGYRPEMMLRQVVNVEPVPASQYRQSDFHLARKRVDQLSERS